MHLWHTISNNYCSKIQNIIIFPQEYSFTPWLYKVINEFKDYDEYRVGVSIPENTSGKEETQLVQNAHNKVRRILGMQEVDL